MRHSMGFGTIAVVAGLGGLLFGYDTGVISGALLYIRDSFRLTGAMQGVVVAVTLAGAAVGAALAGPLADGLGRRTILLFTGLVFVGGAAVCALAWTLDVLIFGRMVVGLAIGIASMLTPLYLAEISPPEQRGAVVTINQLFITIGAFLSYVLDYAMTFLAHGPGAGSGIVWRAMLGLAAVPGAMLLVGMMLLPESPRWLLSCGRSDQAYIAMRWLRAGAAPTDEFEVLRRDISESKKNRAPFSRVFARNVRRPMIIGIGLAIFQQITGINTVIYFAPTIFKDSGIASSAGAILVTAGIGLINVILTIVAMRLLDHVGRRVLLLAGLAGMFVSLLVLSACFGIGLHGNGGHEVALLIVVSIAAYVSFFAIGLGPVFWLLIAEIFPLAIRGRGMSIATVTNWAFNMLVSLTFLDLLSSVGQSTTFLFYAALTALAGLFTWYLVPETKGRSLEEIEMEMDGRVGQLRVEGTELLNLERDLDT